MWRLTLAGNVSDLTVASSQVSDSRHVSELLVPGFGRRVLLCRGRMPRARGRRHKYEMDMEHFANPSLSAVV